MSVLWRKVIRGGSLIGYDTGFGSQGLQVRILSSPPKMNDYIYIKLRQLKEWGEVKEQFAELIKSIILNFPPSFSDNYQKILEGLSKQFDLDLYLEITGNRVFNMYPKFTLDYNSEIK